MLLDPIKVFYKNLFYRLYKLAKLSHYNTTPEYSGLFGMSMFFMLNVFTLISFGDGKEYWDILQFSKLSFGLITILIALINYLILFRYIGINSIIDEFKDEKSNIRIKNATIVGIYMFVTLCLFFYSFNYIKVINQ